MSYSEYLAACYYSSYSNRDMEVIIRLKQSLFLIYLLNMDPFFMKSRQSALCVITWGGTHITLTKLLTKEDYQN